MTKGLLYHVKGMHCASCELLIEKKLLGEKGVKAVEASASDGSVRIEYEGRSPSIEKLNKIFEKDGYTFSTKPSEPRDEPPLLRLDAKGLHLNDKKLFQLLLTGGIAFLLILGFVIFTRSTLAARVAVSPSSAPPAFFLFGLMAGISSCAALVGEIVLSMSKQWSGGVRPHLLFNFGRLISFAVFGILLGAVGNFLQMSLTATALLTVVVSVLMVFLGLQMLGFKKFRRFQLTMPKSVTRFVADERNFRGRYLPFFLGALTIILPCGFTLTAQGVALTSGNSIRGGLIMLFFALGTLPMLLMIGFSSAKLTRKPHTSDQFQRIAGLLVLFFAVYNINAQLNVLGFKSLSDLGSAPGQTAAASQDGFVSLVNGEQVLKMDALSYAYKPNYFKVRVGIPARFEITDKGVSGCTNAVISKGLFEGQIDLGGGQTSVKEFTPQKTGRYKFSCWMGMVSGVIDVVGQDGAVGKANTPAEEVPSGASGCGGGCSGGCGGGCGNPGCSYAR